MNLSQQVVDEIKKHFNNKVYETKIPRTVRLAEAPGFGKPVLLYDKSCKGAEAYLDLAREFLMQHHEKISHSHVSHLS
jgi:chromosome partitioning protein